MKKFGSSTICQNSLDFYWGILLVWITMDEEKKSNVNLAARAVMRSGAFVGAFGILERIEPNIMNELMGDPDFFTLIAVGSCAVALTVIASEIKKEMGKMESDYVVGKTNNIFEQLESLIIDPILYPKEFKQNIDNLAKKVRKIFIRLKERKRTKLKIKHDKKILKANKKTIASFNEIEL